MDFNIIVICGRCASAACNIHFDAANGRFMLSCTHCGLQQEPVIDSKNPPKNMKEHHLMAEKRKLKAELKKLKN